MEKITFKQPSIDLGSSWITKPSDKFIGEYASFDSKLTQTLLELLYPAPFEWPTALEMDC